MSRRSLWAICLCTILLSGCVTPLSQNAAFQPKLEENGGPKELYSIRSDQLTSFFVPGQTMDQITQRFGKPSLSGTGADSAGRPTTWAVYTYGRSYTHVDTSFNVIAVNRYSSATLTFNGSGILTDVSFSRFQKYSNASTTRDATDDEIVRYLGAPQPLDIKPATPTIPATAWKLGADISELRSEQIAKTGYEGRGVYVVKVAPQGLAARAGLVAGDIIVKINGVATPTRDDLIDQIKTTPTTSSLNLQVFSHGKLRNLTVPALQSSEDTSAI